MLIKKMLRDFKDHKAQFLSIFLMVFIGVYAFAGIGAESEGLIEQSTIYYQTTNLADAIIYSQHLTNDTINEINNMSQVKNTEKQLIIPTVGNFTGDPTINLNIEEKGEITKFYTITGEKFNISDENGIWLDKRFADARDLNLGDNITLKYNQLTITKEIKGIGYSPNYVYEAEEGSLNPDFNKLGYAYISYKAFPTEVPYNSLLIDSYNPLPENFQNQLDNTIGEDNYSQYLEQTDFPSYHQFNDEIEQHQMIEGVLPPIFVIVSLLTLVTTMTRLITNQRTQIGTLKALGYSNKSITTHYLSYGFFLSLLGAILGVILGPITIPYIFYPSMSAFYTMPAWQPGFSTNFLIVGATMVILSVLVTFITIRNINQESPAQAIRPKPPKNIKSGIIEKTKLWSKLNFNIRWNYRDAKRNKIRSLMSIFGVLACTVILVASFGAYDSVYDIQDWQYEDINQYNTKLLLEDNITNTQIDKIIEDTNGETIQESPIDIKKNDESFSGMLTVLNDTKLITPTNDKREEISLPSNGIALSSKVAEYLNVEKGDTVSWHLKGSDTWVKSEITQIYSTPVSQGIMIQEEEFNNTEYNYTPTSIVSPDTITDNYTGVKATNTISDLLDSWNEMMDSMMSSIYILIFFAAVLSIVVLYNLGLLSFTEIKREIATLKVLGFTSKSLRRLLLTQNLFFSLIGFIIGLPIGKITLDLMMQTSGMDYMFPSEIYPLNILLTFLITIGISLLVNLSFSRKIKKVDMVESLKDAE